jgi:hypothetical protein
MEEAGPGIELDDVVLRDREVNELDSDITLRGETLELLSK